MYQNLPTDLNNEIFTFWSPYQNLPTELINEIFTFWSPYGPPKMVHEFKICKFLFDLEIEIKADLSPETGGGIIQYKKLKKYVYMYNKLVNTNKFYIQITLKSIVLKRLPRGFNANLYYNENDSFQRQSIENRKLETVSTIRDYILPDLDNAIYNYYICRFDQRIYVYIKEYNRLFPYWKN